MICSVSISNWNDAWKNMTQEQYAELILPLLSPLDQITFAKKPPLYSGMDNVMVDLSLAAPVFDRLGLEVTLKNFSNLYALHSFQDRLKKLEMDYELVKEKVYNGDIVCQIHVPNIGLLAFNEVEVLEDACTDKLQEYLDDGWKIMAVCPPNAQRRPDYILGRYNQNRRLP